MCPCNDILPVDGSIAKTTMLSSPRFEASTQAPEGCTQTAAAVSFPVKVAGRVGLVSMSESVPLEESKAYALSVLSSSLTRYANRPFGWNARCLGPAPGAVGTRGLAFGVSFPEALSKTNCAT